jgi:hypothetical protein
MIGWMFLVFIVIGAVAGVLLAIFEGIGEVMDFVFGVIIGGLIGAMVALLVFLGIILATCGAEYEIVEEPVAQYEIYSLKDNYGVDGYIGRWHGSIDSELEYAYIYEVKGKGLTVGHIPADKTYINFSEDATSVTIYAYTERPKSKFLQWFFGESTNPAEYHIVAPKGSILITDEYIIDLE